MLPDEVEVGGMRCSEVLAVLSEYLDGQLPGDVVQRVVAHVSVCRRCERFGEEFAEAVDQLRAQLQAPPALDAPVASRLEDRLRRDCQ